jgi:hypothetical protein
MHRLAQRRDELVAPKLATLEQIDSELRSLEIALGERRGVTVLREPGVTACPRCAAIHASEDHFCPACGLAMGRHADRPIAANPPAPASPAPSATPAPPTATYAIPATPAPAPPSGAPLTPPPAATEPTSVPPPEDQPTHAFDPPTTEAPSPEEPSGGASIKP